MENETPAGRAGMRSVSGTIRQITVFFVDTQPKQNVDYLRASQVTRVPLTMSGLDRASRKPEHPAST